MAPKRETILVVVSLQLKSGNMYYWITWILNSMDGSSVAYSWEFGCYLFTNSFRVVLNLT